MRCFGCAFGRCLQQWNPCRGSLHGFADVYVTSGVDSSCKKFECPWVGCRAFELAAQLRAVESELRRARDTGALAGIGISIADGISLHIVMLSTFQLKFFWARTAPFTV